MARLSTISRVHSHGSFPVQKARQVKPSSYDAMNTTATTHWFNEELPYSDYTTEPVWRKVVRRSLVSCDQSASMQESAR